MFEKFLEKLMTPHVTVEVIHKEFDLAQDRILDKSDELLKELEIPNETPLERKGKMMKELGFINSITVKEAEELKRNKKAIQDKISITIKQAETIRYYTQKYPLEKFITVDVLNEICNKYGLIYAPVANYIEDIPEKNVLEMKNVKKLDDIDKFEKIYKLIGLPQYMINFLGKTNNEFTISEIQSWKGKYYENTTSLIKWLKEGNTTFTYALLDESGITPNPDLYRFNFMEVIDKEGLFIAAPSSHFNLKGLTKKSEFGFFNVNIQKVKEDPIVFEYCSEYLCRIITKWGNENDKAYLDFDLINEKFN
jgi:hypothetical protein